MIRSAAFADALLAGASPRWGKLHTQVAPDAPDGHNPAPMPTFRCQRCARSFDVPQATLDRYPSWQPKTCMRCRKPTEATGGQSARRPTPPSERRAVNTRSEPAEGTLTLEEVLQTYTGGPMTGVFTDGAAHPNPGPGGRGAVDGT